MSFEIFAPVPDPETTCNGTLLVAYQGGKNRNELIFEEVKNQALHMYRKSTFIDIFNQIETSPQITSVYVTSFLQNFKYIDQGVLKRGFVAQKRYFSQSCVSSPFSPNTSGFPQNPY